MAEEMEFCGAGAWFAPASVPTSAVAAAAGRVLCRSLRVSSVPIRFTFYRSAVFTQLMKKGGFSFPTNET